MPELLRLPGVSADSEEATLVEWAVAVGTELRRGEVIATIETEKATVELESDRDGTLFRTLADAGDVVAVGAPVAVVLIAGEDSPGDDAIEALLGRAPAPSTGDELPAAVDSPSETTDNRADSPPATRTFASPIARRLARAAGLDLGGLVGSGPSGRILRADVEALTRRPPEPPAAPVAPAAPAIPSAFAASDDGVDIPHTSMRRAIATRLTASKRDAPHFYLQATCRVDRLVDLRAELNEGREGPRVSLNDLVVLAAARAYDAVPEMNVVWGDTAVRRFTRVDIAVAVATERGLLTPVVRDAGRLPLSLLSTMIRDAARRAATGGLRPEELSGGALTVTNLGMYGVESFSAIINPPQSAILAVGAVVQRPVVVDGEIVVGRTMSITLSVDHRPVDGVLAARWLAAVVGLIERPLAILA